MDHRAGMRISRRGFIAGAAAGAAGCCLAGPVARGEGTGEETVRKVHVIFKTHLDIGFTDLAAAVMAKYRHEFLPKAIRLARETREARGRQRFKWTTGAWLIDTALEHSDHAGRKTLEDAIASDDLCWHALPFTTHSEALDASVFEAGLQLSQRLDARFGRVTIAGKMTDVPGHTRGIVPLLWKAGVALLHVGVNPACMPPDVPPVFVWRAPDGAQVAVMYQKDYGGVLPIPNTDEAVALVFTGDNHGPQTAAQVAEAYAHLEARYPGAAFFASDLNAVAASLLPALDRLPLLTGEIGDSWIHGIGSDPLKIAQMRELSRRRRTWLADGRLKRHSGVDLAMAVPLALVGEHTWGLDIKTHLHSWDVYTPEALRAARATPRFQRVEDSWREKRAYIQEAMHALPEELRNEAAAALDALRPVRPDAALYGESLTQGQLLETPHYSIALDPATGALTRLTHRASGREWAAPDHPLALFAYQTFSAADYERFLGQYLSARPDWALKDLGKPGLEDVDYSSAVHHPRLRAARMRQNGDACHILAELELVDDARKPIFGAPPEITIEYQLPAARPEIHITLQCFGKAASRLPEAMWCAFVPPTAPDGAWLLDKMGQDIDPGDVVHNGGHKMHAVASGVRYADSGGALRVQSLDAPLAAPGERALLHFDNAVPKPQGGMHFCLYNNVWGTNFVMWFDEDLRFRFILEG